MIDFRNIEYLSSGNPVQQKAFRELTDLKIFEIMAPFDPVLTGTIPIEIDIPGSDLDIICCCDDHEAFQAILNRHFAHLSKFSITSDGQYGELATIASFQGNYFPIEIFAQAIPVLQQNAYRHMEKEYQILQEKGPSFKQQIIDLKILGYKTEPAFVKLLGLEGDPYEVLLAYNAE